MTLADFISSLNLETPPQGITAHLQALWWDGKGNWQRAHDVIEDLGDNDAAWVHAYLHRKEGDNGMHVTGMHVLAGSCRRFL